MKMKDTLRDKLEVFIRKYYQNRLIKGLIYGTGLSLAYFFILAVAEYFGRFNSETRLVLLILLLTGLIMIIGYYIIYPVAKLLNLGKRIGYDKAARIIGRHFPEIDDKIINTLQLQEISTAESDLLRASIDQRIAALNPVPFGNAIDFKENKKYWPILVVPVLVFLVILLAGRWDVVGESGRRIAAFNKEFLPEAPFDFILKNEHLSVEQGDDLTLDLTFSGSSVPSDVVVVMPSGESRMNKTENGDFRFNLDNVQRDMEFRFRAAGFLSKIYRLKVLPIPQVDAFTLQVTPPAYTGVKPFKTEAKLVQDIPEGSGVEWLLNLRQANAAFLVVDTGEAAFERAGKESFRYSKRVRNSFDYGVRTSNELLSKTNITGNRINVIKDEFPRIKVDFMVDSSNANVLYYSGSIRDDYGFSGLKLVIRRGKEKISKTLDFNKDAVNQMFGAALTLDSLSGDNSQEIRIWLEVADNDGVNGAKTARSDEYVYDLVGKKAKKEEIAKEYEKFFLRSEQLQQEMEEIQKALERLRKELMDKRSVGFKEKTKIKELLKKQEELLRKQSQNEELMKKVQKKEEALDPKKEEIKKKEEEIDQLKSEKDKEVEELMKEIQELMEKLDIQKLQEKLDELEKANEQNEKMMDRKDDLLKDLMFQKDVLEQAEKLDRLSKEMERLSQQEDDTEQEDGKTGEEKDQNEVKKEFEEVREKIDELKGQNKAFDKESEKQEMDSKAEEASEELQQSSENLKKNEQQKANESQSKAGQKMKEMSESLQMSMMQMQSQANKMNIETLRQILENLEVLSFDVEELSEKSKEINRGDPLFKTLLTEQRRLKDGAKVIEDSLTMLAKKVPEIQQEVFGELELIKSHLDKSINDLEELRSAQAAAHQQYVMTSANNLALMLDQSLRNMQQMAAQSKPGDQQCEKPGNKPGSKPGMAQLRQMQKGLGERMERMKEGSKEGEGKGKGEGQRGMSGKEMVEILSEQEQLRQALEELSEKEGNQGSKGNLQKAIEEMKELEKDLLNGELGSGYKERLKEIETRLLESEKAELKQDKDERRESEVAEELRQVYERELEKYLKEKGFEKESLHRLPLDFRNYYKNQTSKYLETL